MKRLKLAIAAAMAIAALDAGAAPKEKLEPDAVVLENGPEKVTVLDFDAAMTRFPEHLREEARAYPSIIMKNIDALFVNRVAADKAREAGLDKDPLVRRRLLQLEEAYLAQKYLDYIHDNVKVPDLAARAEEIYKADPKKWLEPATVQLDDIVITFIGRTPEMALERAREAEKRIRAGEDFLAVAGQYTEDRNFAKSRGDLGLQKLKDLDPSVRAAVEGTKVGDITAPVRTGNQVHILRVRAKTPDRQRTFAEVKPIIVAEEEERIRVKATEDYLLQVRTDKNNIIHPERVEALRSDLDLSKIDAARSDAIEKAQTQNLPQVH